MRITPELIENCYQYTNKATTDRELRMRGLKINAIENLGSTLNQFDCFDLTDNSIKKLDNFPLLPRLRCLLLSNNCVFKIQLNLNESIPNLERLILTNNYIQELGDIDALSTFEHLKILSLINNPIQEKPHYRYYVIFKLPQLKLLDFNKIKRKERIEAKILFSGDEGSKLAQSIGIKSTSSKLIDEKFKNDLEERGLMFKKRQKIDDAITAEKDAANMESIQRINNLLKSGYIPGSRNANQDDLMENLDIEGEKDNTE